MKSKILSIVLLLVMFLPITFVYATPSNNDIYNGIDVSNWQGYIDYSQVKNSGIEIVYIKSSQGTNIVDPYFRINYTNAKANGLKVGFYHYLTATNETEAVSQAEFFVSVISKTTPDCRLAMDFERFGDLSNGEINNISIAFLEKVKELTGKEVIIYSDEFNARNVFGEELANKYPLWVAEYGVSEPRQTNWKSWDGFQYSNQGEVKGVRGYVDLDKFTSNIFLESPIQVEESGNSENYSQDTTYIVQRGNTLSGIARRYGTTVRELVTINSIRNPNLIFIGQDIRVPIKSNMQSDVYDLGHIIYTVKAGNTLSELALEFNTTVDSIARLNNIRNVNLIYIGERLRIKN